MSCDGGIQPRSREAYGVCAAAGVALLCACLFWSRLCGGQVLYTEDVGLESVPRLLELRASLLAGRWPVWSDAETSGLYLWSAGSAPLYPLRWLVLVLPPWYVYSTMVIVHSAIAVLGVALLLRRYGVCWAPAVTGGLVYAFGGCMVSRAVHLHMQGILAMLPLVLYFVHRIVDERRIGPVLGASLCLGSCALQDNLHGFALVYAIVPLYASYRLLARAIEARNTLALVRPSAALLCSGLLGMGIGAAQLLPTMEILQQARLEGTRYSGLQFMDEHRVPAHQLANLAFPYLFGGPGNDTYWGSGVFWEGFGYAGVLPLLLGVAFLLGGQGTGPRLFWGLAGLLALAISIGSANPAFRLLTHVPVINHMRCPGRMLILFDLSLAMLTGLCLHQLASSRIPAAGRLHYRILALVGAFLGVSLVVAAGLLAFKSVILERAAAAGTARLGSFGLQETPEALEAISGVARRTYGTMLQSVCCSALWAALGLGVVWAGRRSRRASGYFPGWCPVVLGAIIAGDLLLTASFQNPTTKPDFFHIPPRTAALLHEREGEGWFRILSWEDETARRKAKLLGYSRGVSDLRPYNEYLKELMAPGTNGIWGIDAAAGFGAYSPLRYRDFVYGAFERDERSGITRVDAKTLGVCAIGYIVSRVPLTSPSLQELPGSGPEASFVYRNSAALPRAMLVKRVYLAYTPESALARVLTPDFDPRTEAVIEGAPRGGLQTGPGAAVVRPVSDRGDEVCLETDSAGPSVLVLTDRWVSGWEAAIDGAPAALYRANVFFRGLLVPAGRHRVRICYRPSSLTWGLRITGLSIGIVLLVAAFHAARRARPEAPSREPLVTWQGDQ